MIEVVKRLDLLFRERKQVSPSFIGLESLMLNPVHIDDTFPGCLATCGTHLGKLNNSRRSELHPILYSFSANYTLVDS